MAMEVGITAKLQPELDDRAADAQADELEARLDPDVEVTVDGTPVAATDRGGATASPRVTSR